MCAHQVGCDHTQGAIFSAKMGGTAPKQADSEKEASQSPEIRLHARGPFMGGRKERGVGKENLKWYFLVLLLARGLERLLLP